MIKTTLSPLVSHTYACLSGAPSPWKKTLAITVLVSTLIAAAMLVLSAQAVAQESAAKSAQTGQSAATAKSTQSSKSNQAAKPAKAVEISWDDLIPQGWDPSSEFADLIEQGAEAWEDTDPRAKELYARLRKVWDSAPVVPEMAGKNVRLPGYVVALEEGKDGLREMLLVPNFGACIHTPPPPANQIIHVRLPKPAKGYESLDAVWITGKLEVKRNDSEMGVSGYAITAEKIEKYRE